MCRRLLAMKTGGVKSRTSEIVNIWANQMRQSMSETPLVAR